MKRLGAVLDAQLVEAPLQTDADGQPVLRDLCLDRGYDDDACRETAAAHGYRPHIPPKASAEQPLPPPGDPARHPARRWVVEVGHAWAARFRRLARDDERLPQVLAGLHVVAFACLMLHRLIPVLLVHNRL